MNTFLNLQVDRAGTAFIISSQTAATMDDLIPKAPGPLLSHQPHTLVHTHTHILSHFVLSVNLMITRQVLLISLLTEDTVNEVSEGWREGWMKECGWMNDLLNLSPSCTLLIVMRDI